MGLPSSRTRFRYFETASVVSDSSSFKMSSTLLKALVQKKEEEKPENFISKIGKIEHFSLIEMYATY